MENFQLCSAQMGENIDLVGNLYQWKKVNALAIIPAGIMKKKEALLMRLNNPEISASLVVHGRYELYVIYNQDKYNKAQFEFVEINQLLGDIEKDNEQLGFN